MCKALISLLFCRPSSRSTVLFLFFTVVRGGGNSSSCPPFSPSFFYPLFLNPFSSCIVSPPSHILSSSSRVPSSPCHFPIISSSTFHCLLISLLSPHHLPIISPSSPHHFLIISTSSPHHLPIISSSSPHHIPIIFPSSPHHLPIISSLLSQYR